MIRFFKIYLLVLFKQGSDPEPYCHQWHTMQYHYFHFWGGFSSRLSPETGRIMEQIIVLIDWTMFYTYSYINFIPEYVHIVWISITNIKNFGLVSHELTICAAIFLFPVKRHVMRTKISAHPIWVS